MKHYFQTCFVNTTEPPTNIVRHGSFRLDTRDTADKKKWALYELVTKQYLHPDTSEMLVSVLTWEKVETTSLEVLDTFYYLLNALKGLSESTFFIKQN